MMGAALVVSPSVEFLTALEEVASELGLGRFRGDGNVQLTDSEGRLLTAFDDVLPEDVWNDATPRGAKAPLHVTGVVGYAVECRWADLFCEVLGTVAANARTPMWVSDTDGVLWEATDLDPAEICL